MGLTDRKCIQNALNYTKNTQCFSFWVCVRCVHGVMFEGKVMSVIQKSNMVQRKKDIAISILTRAEATCLAMVNIRLSVISHGGSTFSWKDSTSCHLNCLLLLLG